MPQKGRSYRARVVWRSGEGIGVEFHSTDAKRPQEARLRELETENAQLKARIMSLEQKARGSRARPEYRSLTKAGKGRRGQAGSIAEFSICPTRAD